MSSPSKLFSEYEVCIVICCYNSENTIKSSLESILSQDFSSYHILLIDDGSTDNTVSIISSLKSTDPRISLLCNDRNRGTAYTRMRGITTAQTKWVMFFDSDDLASPNLLSRLVDKIREDEKIIGVSCYAEYFDGQCILGLQKIGPTSKEIFFNTYLHNRITFLLPVTLFSRLDALSVGGYRLDIMPNSHNIRYEDFSEDVDLWSRMSDLARDGRYFIVIPEPLFKYRKSFGSISTRNVHLMQLKMRWIKDCLKKRRSGIDEFSLLEFIESRSFFDRINDLRLDSAAFFYKRAAFSYANKKYIYLAIFLIFSSILSPKLIFNKFKSQKIQTSF